jgi:O-antigen/teichoic acid export membrane protein
LIPLAILGWINGLGDRYIIGGILGLEEAGIYAAVYGLVSRPFLLLGRVVELTLRPVYQTAVSQRNHQKARKAINSWLIVTIISTTLGFVLILVLHKQLAFILLGERYRVGAEFMPWIAGGYVLLVTSYVFEKICYAYEQTKYVLYTQISSAVATLLTTFVAITYWGLYGAAVAVPVYFGVQLIVSYLFAVEIERKVKNQKFTDIVQQMN